MDDAEYQAALDGYPLEPFDNGRFVARYAAEQFDEDAPESAWDSAWDTVKRLYDGYWNPASKEQFLLGFTRVWSQYRSQANACAAS